MLEDFLIVCYSRSMNRGREGTVLGVSEAIEQTNKQRYSRSEGSSEHLLVLDKQSSLGHH